MLDRIIKSNGWKGLGAFLVFFSLMVGLITPLGPGIISLSPDTIQSGDSLIIKVKTINAHFLSHPEGFQGAVSLENQYLIKAKEFHILSDNEVDLKIQIPVQYSPKKGMVELLDLQLASDYDGFLVLRQSLKLKPINLDSNSQTRSMSSLSPSNDQTLKIKRLSPQWFSFPYREILYESVRNLFFHVVMWFAMLSVFFISVIYSIRYLRTGKSEYDLIAVESVQVGLVFATLGVVTGSLWARYTWGDWWPNDPKLNGTAIAILLYFAYIILRNSINEDQQRAKISSVYNVFAFPLMVVVILVLPRLTASLHPGNGGNPAFSTYDLDSHLRIAFYPAALGWILISLWILDIRVRIRKLEEKRDIQSSNLSE